MGGAGLISDPDDLIVSADVTCIESHASTWGKRVDEEPAVTTLSPTATDVEPAPKKFRRFADPEARWGWDSYRERWFYGYTGYFLSTHNPDKKLDLPLYIHIEKVSAFDGVTFIKTLADARRLWRGTFVLLTDANARARLCR